MGEKSKYSFSDMMFSSALIHNPVLIQAIGLGAVVAVATTLKTALLLAVAFVPVMVVTQMIACLMLKRVPRWIRVTLYLLIGVAITAPIMYLIDRINPDIRLGAGVYLALTAASPITAMHCEKFAVKTDLKHAFYDAVAAAAGYGAVIILAGFLRELFGMSCIWGKHVSLPFTFPSLLMPFGGFILLAFCAAGLKALINKRFPEYSQETELEIKKTSVIVSKK
ncbi:MAG: Rnf-Nqr domain containing protein, partial [Acutalibacteraceae bacterium]